MAAISFPQTRTALSTIPSPRCLLALAALLAAAPAAAQTHLDADAGLYLGLHDARYESRAYVTGPEVERLEIDLDLTVGYRFASGLDAGLRVGVEYLGAATSPYFGAAEPFPRAGHFRLGPVLGYTRATGPHTGLRLEAEARYERFWISAFSQSQTQTLAAEGSASAYRTLRWKRLAFHPGAGLYAHARHLAELPEPTEATAHLSRTRAGAGLQLDLPLSLRVLGHRHVTVDPFLRYGYGTWETVEARRYLSGGLSLRFNF